MGSGGAPLTIAVLVKQAPDMNAVRIDRATGTAVFGGQPVVNSYDEHAIEAAVCLQETHGGQTVAVTAGPAGAKDALTRALAMGIDRGIHVEVADPNAHDTLALATVLAEQIRPLGVDLLIAGQAADDWETGQVGAQVAALLDLPLVSNIVSIEVAGGALTAKRDIEDGYQTVTAPLPAALLASTGLNQPRLPSLKGIMAAKKKPIDKVAAAPAGDARMTWSAPKAPEKTIAGVLVQDVPAAEAARQLVAWLKEQKVL